jgi:hypothetical protein
VGVLWSKSCRAYKSYAGLRHSRGGAGLGPVGLLWRTRHDTPPAGPVGWLLWWTRPGTPHGGPGWSKSGSPGVSGRARSAWTPSFVTYRRIYRTTTGSAIENVAPRFCRWIKMQNCRVIDARTHKRSEFIYKIWVNSLVTVNEDQWKSNEFTGLMNKDSWTALTFCKSLVRRLRTNFRS